MTITLHGMWHLFALLLCPKTIINEFKTLCIKGLPLHSAHCIKGAYVMHVWTLQHNSYLKSIPWVKHLKNMSLCYFVWTLVCIEKRIEFFYLMVLRKPINRFFFKALIIALHLQSGLQSYVFFTIYTYKIVRFGFALI